MKSSVIAKIIKTQIVGKSEIILPSIGAIEMQDLPATFSEDGKTINPPFRKVVFNTLRFNDDDILATLAAEAEGVGLPEGRQIVKDYIAEVRASLSKEKRYEIDGVGVLAPSKRGGIEFTADPGFEAVSDSFGLETVCIEDVCPENNYPENDCPENVGTESACPKIIERSETERVEIGRLETELEGNENIEEIRKETREETRPDNAESTETGVTKREPEKTEPESEKKDSAAEENGTGNTGTKEAAEKTETEINTKAKPQQEGAKKRNRTFVTLMWIFIAVITVIIIAVLIYVFREPLRPVLEKVLYDSEQLKIIRLNM